MRFLSLVSSQSVLLILEREKARKTLRHMAAKMIGTFWLTKLRMRQAKSRLNNLRRVNSFAAAHDDTRFKVEVKEDFKKVLAMSKIDTERMGGVERKVNQIVLSFSLDRLCASQIFLWDVDCVWLGRENDMCSTPSYA